MQRTILIIGLVLLLVVSSGCINDVNEEKAPPEGPEIIWGSGSHVLRYHYLEGVLIGASVHQYFRVVGGSGEVEITVERGDDNRTNTFAVEEGKSYKLAIPFRLIQVRAEPYERDLIISSPSAASPAKITIRLDGNIIMGSLWKMNLDEWESPPLNLIVYVYGSGSVSPSVGSLVKEEREGVPTQYDARYDGKYKYGTEVTLTAIPAPGYVFDSWQHTRGFVPWGVETDIVTVKSPSFTVTMTDHIAIMVLFSEQ